MTKQQPPPTHSYFNAMETLAIEEIDRQLQRLSVEVVNSINKGDAIAYALNRLPPLYSTTQEGWYWQQQRAKETLQDLICKAAGWGINAARREKKIFLTQLTRHPEIAQNLQHNSRLLDEENAEGQPEKKLRDYLLAS